MSAPLPFRSPSPEQPAASLTDEERIAILDALDLAEDRAGDANARQRPRVRYRRSDVPIRIEHPGGSASLSKVMTRNLSCGGISFLYPGYLHAGTVVQLSLPGIGGGQELVVRGVVRHCALIRRGCHLVGVRFEQKCPTPGGARGVDAGSVISAATQDPAKNPAAA